MRVANTGRDATSIVLQVGGDLKKKKTATTSPVARHRDSDENNSRARAPASPDKLQGGGFMPFARGPRTFLVQSAQNS